jgi:hypothetical protein
MLLNKAEIKFFKNDRAVISKLLSSNKNFILFSGQEKKNAFPFNELLFLKFPFSLNMYNDINFVLFSDIKEILLSNYTIIQSHDFEVVGMIFNKHFFIFNEKIGLSFMKFIDLLNNSKFYIFSVFFNLLISVIMFIIYVLLRFVFVLKKRC